MEVEHTLKWGEKKYGYICILSHNRKAFSKLKGKRFVVKIGDEVLLERHLDPKGRIYLSTRPLRAFKVGDKLIISLENDVLTIKKITD